MSQKSHTKEERFLIALYDKASDEGDLDAAHNRYEIGKSLGLHDRGINTICRDLLQCNFIKKSGDEDISLTSHGKSLVLQLIEE